MVLVYECLFLTNSMPLIPHTITILLHPTQFFIFVYYTIHSRGELSKMFVGARRISTGMGVGTKYWQGGTDFGASNPPTHKF